jgi:hypothetical protein
MGLTVISLCFFTHLYTHGHTVWKRPALSFRSNTHLLSCAHPVNHRRQSEVNASRGGGVDWGPDLKPGAARFGGFGGLGGGDSKGLTLQVGGGGGGRGGGGLKSGGEV